MTATLSLFPDLAPAPIRRVPVKRHMRRIWGEAKPKTAHLGFTPGERGRKKATVHWCHTKDGDVDALAMYRRHYSCLNKKPKIEQLVGPGEKCVLISCDGNALFVWRYSRYWKGQKGVNCAVFRNEGSVLSSLLILEAESVCQEKWVGLRMFTFVNPKKITNGIPGYCFMKAGWKRRGKTKRGLVILEKLP